jgi:quinol monooxygenase YgiN
MIVVAGRFRLPPERIEEARPAMAKVIAHSTAETGCRVYAYAEDVAEPGLFRVYEEWDSRAPIEAHFASEHMREWQRVRETLGFHDRAVAAWEVGEPMAL